MRGGRQPGAGRPPGRKNNTTLNKEQAREVARLMITAKMEQLIAAQLQAACGLKYLVARDANGKFQRIGPEGVNGDAVIEVWEKDPSTAAFTDLMNRALDRPKEQPHDIIVSNREDLLARLDSWKVANRQAAEAIDVTPEPLLAPAAPALPVVPPWNRGEGS
jgi:hypothetical protein